MRPRHVTAALIVLAGVALAAPSANAKEPTHTLRDGETVEAVARHFYGAGWKAVYLFARNNVESSRDAKSGQRLIVPSSWTYTVRRGDSFARISKKYLGKSERYAVLARENGMSEKANLDLGAQLLMPFHLSYVVKRGDSLSAVSKRFYRTTRKAKLIAEYNTSTDAIEPGQRLVVPIFDKASLDVRTKGSPPAPKTSARAASNAGRASPKPSANTLKVAIETYLAGDFGRARDMLDDLLEANPPNGTKATILRYLGFCAVAHGRRGDAEDAFAAWLKVDPGARLDPVQTSPKILEVFNEVLNETRDDG